MDWEHWTRLLARHLLDVDALDVRRSRPIPRTNGLTPTTIGSDKETPDVVLRRERRRLLQELATEAGIRESELHAYPSP